MALITLKPALLTAVAALLSGNAQAWTTPMRSASVVRSHQTFSKTVLSMAEEDDLDKVQLTSARKELMFDDKSGRFFETNLDAVECIPEEEYCRIDEETGEKIRLTVAEKERIFLDALQVRSIFIHWSFSFFKFWFVIVFRKLDSPSLNYHHSLTLMYLVLTYYYF